MPTPSDEPTTPWSCSTAREAGEPSAWYGRFLRFCQLGPGRSTIAALNAERAERGLSAATVLPASWKRMAERWNWIRRAVHWDAYADAGQVLAGCIVGDSTPDRGELAGASTLLAGVRIDRDRGGIVAGGVFVSREALAAYLAVLDGEGAKGAPKRPPRTHKFSTTDYRVTSIRRLAVQVGRSHVAVRKWLRHRGWPAGIARKPPWTADEVGRIKAWADSTLAPDPIVSGYDHIRVRSEHAVADKRRADEMKLGQYDRDGSVTDADISTIIDALQQSAGVEPPRRRLPLAPTLPRE